MNLLSKALPQILLGASMLVVTGAGSAVSYADEHQKEQASFDFGLSVEKQLNHKAQHLFGIKKPLKDSASESLIPYRKATQAPELKSFWLKD